MAMDYEAFGRKTGVLKPIARPLHQPGAAATTMKGPGGSKKGSYSLPQSPVFSITGSTDITKNGGGTATATAASTSALVGSASHLAQPNSKRRVLAAYWILGLCNNYGYVVMISAAVDILGERFGLEGSNDTIPGARKCSYMSTGAVLLADIIPSLVIKFLSPFLPLWIHMRLGTVVLLNLTGFILVAFAPSLWVALTGVASLSLAAGLGEVSLLSYTAFYKDKNIITMWSSGTGGAGVLGALSYALLTTVLEPKDTLLVMIAVPVAMGLSFWVLMVHPRIDPDIEEAVCTKGLTDTKVHDDVPQEFTQASMLEKFRDIPPLLRYIVPLSLVYLFEYFINQGLHELISYQPEWLNKDPAYRWYQVDYQIGVFISRSSGSLIRIKKIWVLALLQGLNVLYFTLESVYGFSGSIWIIFVLVFWEGLLGGAAYVNTFLCISNTIPAEKREFSMAISSVGDSIGISLAGIIAIHAHNLLCQLPLP